MDAAARARYTGRMTDAPAQRRMDATDWTILAVLSLMWGCAFFFLAIQLRALPPFTIVLIRVGGAAILLLGWAAGDRAEAAGAETVARVRGARRAQQRDPVRALRLCAAAYLQRAGRHPQRHHPAVGRPGRAPVHPRRARHPGQDRRHAAGLCGRRDDDRRRCSRAVSARTCSRRSPAWSRRSATRWRRSGRGGSSTRASPRWGSPPAS